MDMPGNVTVRSQDVGSRLSPDGSIHFHTGARLELTSSGRLDIPKHFSFDATVESHFNTIGGILFFDGPGGHQLEVGSTNNGTNGTVSNNFSFGNLTLGQQGPSTLMLLDVVNNGNRGPAAAEALYLNGLTGIDGLSLLNGSILTLNGIDVYARIGGVMTHLNALFGPGQTFIPFGGGFLRNGPLAGLRGDFDQNGVINALDLDLMLQATRSDAKQLLFDLTGDALVSQLDLDEMIHNVLHTEYGDIDLSGTVSIGDLVIMAANFGLASTVNTSWANGDLNGDQQVSIGDLTILAQFFGFSGGAPAALGGEFSAALSATSTTAIPLPAAWPAGLALLGGLWLRRRARGV